ncbi:MAG: DUF4351 domain-containing protein [Thermosynechococcaceae cyanobacterium]
MSRQLVRRFGVLSPESEEQVRSLTLAQLDELGEALLDRNGRAGEGEQNQRVLTVGCTIPSRGGVSRQSHLDFCDSTYRLIVSPETLPVVAAK